MIFECAQCPKKNKKEEEEEEDAERCIYSMFSLLNNDRTKDRTHGVLWFVYWLCRTVIRLTCLQNGLCCVVDVFFSIYRSLSGVIRRRAPLFLFFSFCFLNKSCFSSSTSSSSSSLQTRSLNVTVMSTEKNLSPFQVDDRLKLLRLAHMAATWSLRNKPCQPWFYSVFLHTLKLKYLMQIHTHSHNEFQIYRSTFVWCNFNDRIVHF